VTDKEYSYDHRADKEFWPAAVDTSVNYYKKSGKWVEDEETYLRLINEAIASGSPGISLRIGNNLDMDNLPFLGEKVWDKLEGFSGSGNGMMRTITYVFRYKSEADSDNDEKS